MSTFQNSYVVTNRVASDGGYGSHILPSGELTFLLAPVPGAVPNYVSDATAFTSQGTTSNGTLPAAFSAALLTDLAQTVDANGRAYLTVFIHGLDTDWAGSVSDLALVGCGLSGTNTSGGPLMTYDPIGLSCVYTTLNATYPGLVIGFSWPCVGTSFLAGVGLHRTRENANVGVASLNNLIVALQALASTFSGGLYLCVVAHSEGNYVLQQAASALATTAPGSLQQLVLLAPDLDTTALGAYTDKDPCGDGLSQVAAGVTAYWSTQDDVLGDLGNEAAYLLTQVWGTCIRDGTIGRLGKSGPPSDQTLYTNCTSLDCSNVVTKEQLCNGEETHVAYLYMPLVLQDIATVLVGGSPTGRSGSAPFLTLED